MGNLLQKTIASALCISFFATQATFANQMTGTVLNGNETLGGYGAGGADIVSSKGGFIGFETDRLKNNAELNFNGDAIINWGHLNVGGNQSLTFNNGSNVVLNNVQNGMSTFAGMVKGDSGNIIISNPNGIIMQGGKFETAGALTLTTKDLSGIKVTDLSDELVLKNKIENAGYKNEYAVIIFKEGKANVFAPTKDARIEAGDINIIAKGIDVSKAQLVANNGNVVFKTTDGANFVAERANNQFGTNFKDGNTIQVANASIKTPTGTIQFVTKGTGNVSVASVKTNNSYSFKTENGNVSIESPNNNVKVANSDINGNLEVKGRLDVPNNWDDLWNLFNGNSDVLGDIEIANSKITGTTKLQTLGNIVVKNCQEIGNLIADSTFRGIKVSDSNIKGDANFNVSGKSYDILPYYNVKDGKWINSVYVAPKGGVVATNTNIAGTINLNVKNNAEFNSPENLNFANPNIGGKLTANAKNISFQKDGSLTINNAFSNKYKLNATNELTFKTDKNLTADNQVFKSKITKFFAENIFLTNVDTDVATHQINAEGKNITFTQNGKNLTINEMFNSKYNLNADNTLTFKTDKVLTAENQTFKSKLTNFFADDIFLTNVDTSVATKQINAEGKNITFTQNGKDLTINEMFNTKYKLNADNTLTFKTNKVLTAENQTFNSQLTNFFADNINLDNVKTTNSGIIYAEGKNIAFKQNGDLKINNEFNSTYQLKASEDLSFNINGDIIADSNNIGFQTAKSTSFEGKNVTLKDITTNTLKVVAQNGKIVANNVTARAEGVWNNIAAKFEGKEVISNNSNYEGETFVKANNATFESSNNLTFATGSSVNNQFKAKSNANITINDMNCNKIQANGKNVTLNKSSDLTIDNNIKLVASDDVNVKANGILEVIETTIEGNNIKLDANEISTTDAIYTGNVKMDSKGGITFNNNNSIAGTLTAKANNDINFRGITRADSDVTVDTKANAIVHNVEVKNGTLAINNARNISVNNCSSDKLAIVNTPDNKFDYAEIYNTYAGTTEFGHGKYLYIDLTQSNLYRNNIKAILDNAYNVDKIVFNPINAIYGQESSKTMNNLRAKGINTNIEQNFAPIAFAANDNSKNAGLFKVAGDKVFKDLEKVVHITDKFIID